jgi:hypothetical protein
MSYQPFVPKPSKRWTLFLLVLLAFLAFAAMWAGKSMRRKGQAAGSSEFLGLQPGQIAKVVLEVTAIPSDHRLTGKLLEKQNETRYTRTSTEVDVSLDARTRIMMGSRSDVRSGAILHVTGSVEENHALRASQVVVLTEYVTLSR